jgi:hypothetical protein
MEQSSTTERGVSTATSIFQTIVRSVCASIVLLTHTGVYAQPDTLFKHVQLDEFVVSAQATGFSVEAFMQQVRADTSFHKAFLNTRYHPHRMYSALVVSNKGEHEVATLYRETRLERTGDMARQWIDTERVTGKLRDRKGEFRYLTAEMYDDVFFPKGGYVADNSVAARKLEVERGSRFEKYKSELKKFMFDPGSEIASVPFIGGKLALFEPHMAPLYDFRIWSDTRNGHLCWVFSADAKPEHRDGKTVIKTMDTWFDQETNEVMARQYRIESSSLILDFDITIKVENAHIDGALVPTRVDYDGDWNIPFKKRELVKFWLVYKGWEIRP